MKLRRTVAEGNDETHFRQYCDDFFIAPLPCPDSYWYCWKTSN